MTQHELYNLKQRAIAIFDKALQNGDWESRTLFRAIGKQLREFRDRIQNEVLPPKQQNSADFSLQMQNQNFKTVYISLYQMEYRNLQRWLHSIKALTDYCITRPIYADEEAIKKALREKEDNLREAYVIAKVNSAHIIEHINGQALTDRLGNRLIRIKENVLKPEHIQYFIHDNKQYQVVDNSLVLVQQA